MGQNFFLTGCASGIAKHLTGRLLEAGHRVYATDINIEGLDKTAEEQDWDKERVRTQQLNVGNYANWEEVFGAAVNEFGHIDVIGNIAGILKSGWIQDMPLDEVDMQVEVNIKGVMYGTQVAARHMIERKSGHIINIASMAGMAPIPGLAVYSGTKYAVRGFSMACASELRQYNIAVTAVCPDAVATPMTEIPVENEAADIIWSSGEMLTEKDIGDLIMNRVLPKKPVVAVLPRGRGIQARLGDLLPNLGYGMIAGLRKKGKEARSKDRRLAKNA